MVATRYHFLSTSDDADPYKDGTTFEHPQERWRQSRVSPPVIVTSQTPIPGGIALFPCLYKN